MERQRANENPITSYSAYVTPTGGLLITGRGPKGAFAFAVEADGWGWCQRLM